MQRASDRAWAFPTAGPPRPLSELAIPSDFQDPLALAFVVDLTGVEEMRSFFEKLGARQLTLATYSTDFLAPAIEDGKLSDAKREKATRLIATRLNEIRDTPSVRKVLRSLPLVRCTDGAWRPGLEVYLRDGLGLLIGNNVPIAEMPTIDSEAHRDLFEWLGAAREPRPHDIEAQCQRLTRGSADHRRIAEAIIDYTAKRFTADPEKAKVDFAPLQNISWLPVEGDHSRGHRPELVCLRFRKSLFAS